MAKEFESIGDDNQQHISETQPPHSQPARPSRERQSQPSATSSSPIGETDTSKEGEAHQGQFPLSERYEARTLAADHIAHLLGEGFTPAQIAQLQADGVCTLAAAEALKLDLKIWDGQQWQSGRGIYFPFTPTFGQLRLDLPLLREGGREAKYVTPYKAQSQASIPDGCRAITEGYKDALAGSLHGKIPTGAIAGVSHYRKALPGGSGYTVLFDADGWHNPQVFRNLFNAGLWLKGKVQLLPQIAGQPKAGLCEYFQAGYTAADYRSLLEAAYTPQELLMDWANHWQGLPDLRRSMAIATALDLAAVHLDSLERDTVLQRINKATRISTSKLRSLLQAAINKHQQQENNSDNQSGKNQQQRHREWRYEAVAKALQLELDNCVTSQTFDGWIYRRLFAGGEGEWTCENDAFFQYAGNGAWKHVEDVRIHKLITDASTSAYRLKFVKEEGWVDSYPYEDEKNAASAFKFCRKRLVPKSALPANAHLVAFSNCTVDMRTGQTLPHNPEHRTKRYIPYEYQPGRDCPAPFLNFIASAYGLDLLPVIRAFTSMFLDPTAPYGRFPHLIGASGSGKGTLGRFWLDLVGKEGAASLAAFSEISTPEGRYQHLTGKSICGIPDVGGYQSGLRAFYELVDNGALSGRALFSPVANTHPWHCRFWVASVDYLQIENAGDGWERRAYPLPTLGKPELIEQDLHLKLQDCMADVISWALAMPRPERDAILTRKPTNDRVLDAIADAKLHGDSARVFVDMCLRPTADENAFISKQDIHSRYVVFCQAFGYQPASYTKLNNHLRTFLPKNHIERSWSPMQNGQRQRIPAHWGYLQYVSGAFENITSNSSNGYQSGTTEPMWVCLKSRCTEGGLTQIEQFWNPPPPNNNNGGNGNGGGNTPPPSSPSGSGGLVARTASGGSLVKSESTSSLHDRLQDIRPSSIATKSLEPTIHEAVRGGSIESIVPKSPEPSIYKAVRGGSIGSTLVLEEKKENKNIFTPKIELKKNEGVNQTSIQLPKTESKYSSELIRDTLHWLMACESVEAFEQIFYPEGELLVERDLLKAACELLPLDRDRQMQKWLLALDSQIQAEAMLDRSNRTDLNEFKQDGGFTEAEIEEVDNRLTEKDRERLLEAEADRSISPDHSASSNTKVLSQTLNEADRAIYIYEGNIVSSLVNVPKKKKQQLGSIKPQQEVIILDAVLSDSLLRAGRCYVKPVNADWLDGVAVFRSDLRGYWGENLEL